MEICGVFWKRRNNMDKKRVVKESELGKEMSVRNTGRDWLYIAKGESKQSTGSR